MTEKQKEISRIKEIKKRRLKMIKEIVERMLEEELMQKYYDDEY